MRSVNELVLLSLLHLFKLLLVSQLGLRLHVTLVRTEHWIRVRGRLRDGLIVVGLIENLVEEVEPLLVGKPVCFVTNLQKRGFIFAHARRDHFMTQ